MPTTTRRPSDHGIVFIAESDSTAIGTTAITLDLSKAPLCRAWNCAVEFYSNAPGTTPVSPTAATATFTGKSLAQPGTAHKHRSSAINATAATVDTTTMNGYLRSITCTLTTVTAGTATHWRIRTIGTQL